VGEREVMTDLEKNWRALLIFMEQICYKIDIDPDETTIKVSAEKLGGESRELASLNLGEVFRDAAALKRKLR
jgi:hypothetical protein